MRQNKFPRPRVAISACLLGQKVRFDGQHKHDSFITGVLGQFVDFIPICPEVEMGLGTPRESLRIVESQGKTSLIAPRSGRDLTSQITDYAKQKIAELMSMNLSGVILKKSSPSCGAWRVRVYGENNNVRRDGSGFFAKELMRSLPLLPVEEEGRLHDMHLRENFVVRIFTLYRLKEFFSQNWTQKDLIQFHQRAKFILIAHSPQKAQELGRLVSGAKNLQREDVETRYVELFMKAMGKIAYRKNHTNVLQHITGHLRSFLTSQEKEEFTLLVGDYAKGLIPLVVPMTFLSHFASRYNIEYVKTQFYLWPYPKELVLSNEMK